MRIRNGFTIIELSLSMVFVGILSIAIVLVINNTIAAYQRGMTLNSINTTGMDIVDDMRAAVQNSSADGVSALCTVYYDNDSAEREKCLEDGAYNFVSVTREAPVHVGEDRIESLPVFGAFCTGTYSYIWNSGYFMNNEIGDSTERRVDGTSSAVLVYRDALNAEQRIEFSLRDEDGEKPFRLLKIRDDLRSVCVSVVREYNEVTKEYENNYDLPVDGISNEFNIANGYGIVTEEPVDILLADQDNDLVLYDLAIARPAESTTQENMFYSASFILGTIRGGINITAHGQSCKPPMEHETEVFDYCAINKFNFAVQASGE